LNDHARRLYEEKHRAEAFERQLDAIMRKARPQDYPDAAG
jgi:hypothetical protein